MCSYHTLVNPVENDKSLGNIDRVSDVINFAEIYQLFLQALRTRFILKFITFRSVWPGAYARHSVTPMERDPGALPLPNVVVFLQRSVGLFTPSGEMHGPV